MSDVPFDRPFDRGQPSDRESRDELNSLLGAYALDALEPEDRARVDAYLERDEKARSEVDDMRETAAALALAPTATVIAPPELWDRIAATIAPDPDTGDAEFDELAARRSRHMRHVSLRWIAPATAAAAIAIAVLAAQVASLHHQLDQARQPGPTAIAAAFDRATKASGAREVALASSSGATVARLVVLPDGTGYLRGDHMGALPADETYQLWALMGHAGPPTVVSAGVLGSSPSATTFRASGPVVGFAITVERAGGVVKSEHQPIASARLA